MSLPVRQLQGHPITLCVTQESDVYMNEEKTLSVCDFFDLSWFRLAPSRFWLCGDDMFSIECELSMDSVLGSLPVDLMYSEAVSDEVHSLTNEVLLPYSVEELDAMGDEERWDGW